MRDYLITIITATLAALALQYGAPPLPVPAAPGPDSGPGSGPAGPHGAMAR